MAAMFLLSFVDLSLFEVIDTPLLASSLQIGEKTDSVGESLNTSLCGVYRTATPLVKLHYGRQEDLTASTSAFAVRLRGRRSLGIHREDSSSDG